MTLNETQKARIQKALKSGNFNSEKEIETLINEGFPKEQAALKVDEEIDLHKQVLFEEILKSKQNEEHQEFAFMGVAMVAMVGPLFGISSSIWYIASIFIAAGLGYWAYKNKPIAGVIGAICLALTLPFFYNWYTSGRSSIIKIELLIPIAISMAMSYSIGWLTYKIVYK
jgi:hypothetical protein